MPFNEFKRRLSEKLSDDGKIYETLAADVFGLGSFLGTKKYRFVRWSYICFLTGAVAAAVQIGAIFVLGIL